MDNSYLGFSLILIDWPSRKIYQVLELANDPLLAAQTSVCPSSPGQSIYWTTSFEMLVISLPTLGKTSIIKSISINYLLLASIALTISHISAWSGKSFSTGFPSTSTNPFVNP